MRKYIDADKMLEEYKHSIYDTTDLAEMLNYMPAADVVEVCRCGECENWKADFPYNTCALFGGRWNENMFCWYGERKDG